MSSLLVDPSLPRTDFTLSWVYGYQAQSVRNSLKYVNGSDVVWSAASVGVLYNPTAHTQRFNRDSSTNAACTAEVTALAVSYDGRHVAMGERGRRPVVVVFDARSGATESIMTGHRCGVAAMAFSRCGRKLVTVGADVAHTVRVYHWRSGNAIDSQRGGGNTVLSAAFARDDSVFVTVGVRHVYFWSRARGRRGYRKRRGLMGTIAELQPLLCVAWTPANAAVAGAADGSLYMFRKGGSHCLDRVVKGHAGPVTALAEGKGGQMLSGGSEDCTFKVWDGAFSSEHLAIEFSSGVRSVDAGNDGSYLVGTAHSEAYRVVDGEPEALAEGHFAVRHSIGEVWGLAMHPATKRFATTGDDGTLRLWDGVGHARIGMVALDSMARAAAFSSDGGLLAVGLGGRLGGKEEGQCGAWRVFSAETLDELAMGQACDAWVQDIRFSPDGNTLAVAAHDNSIYLYDVLQAYALRATCTGHSSFVTHMDFSADSAALRTNCGAYELLFWDVATGEQRTSGASELKDAAWATDTCVLGWAVQGVWGGRGDGTEINALDRSKDQRALLTATDTGQVRLYNYPVLTQRSRFRLMRGHSSHVTNVRWAYDDRSFVSLGGNDRAVFQWEHV